MADLPNIPDSPLEQVEMLEHIVRGLVTLNGEKGKQYKYLREKLMADPIIKKKLPSFVIKCRNISGIYGCAKLFDEDFRKRREFIHDAFTPLIDHLNGQNNAPSDATVSDVLKEFDTDGVHAVWAKALERRDEDPEGAITIARTLLETVLMRILDETKQEYAEKDDLPKLYQKVSKQLNLAPSDHSERSIKEILGSITNLINGIGTLRNRFSDAHAHSKNPVRPSPRHANLAVNSAGTVATFLVETYLAQKERECDE